MKTRVVHVKKEKYDVYIGRSGAVLEPGMITQKVTYGYFGNPFRIGRDGTREEVIAKYKVWFYERLKTDPEFKTRIEALKGKTLGCFCVPEKCHGNVIIEYLEAEPSR